MRPIRLVAHTHWDREWYLSFESFRNRLISTLDLVLDCLLGDERWTHFHLDGQTAMIDDYLEIRPDRRADIVRLVRAGRLSCGPWVTLVDEFLVSGESMLRNLADGMERASALGGATSIGYIPDQFGHVGQMPQLLRRAGITTAVVWRGVPSDVIGSGFRWAAPDGSEVDALYMPWGYGQGARMGSSVDAFVRRIAFEEQRSAPFLRKDEPLLLMTGDDHEPLNPHLPDLVEAAAVQGMDVAISSLSECAGSFDTPSTRVEGELRSAARANLLPNTYSVRAYQKAERAGVEHALERYAQPLTALAGAVAEAGESLARAWDLLHLNGAHDSVCGCSTDEVAAAVDDRARSARALCDGVTKRALSGLASSLRDPGNMWFNPSPFERDGVPGLGWSLDATPERAQPVAIGADRDGWVRVGSGPGSFRLSVVDQGDAGDLYTFEANGAAAGPESIEVRDGVATLGLAGCEATISANRAPGEPFARLDVALVNDAPDHRVQLVIDTPSPGSLARAGSVFEIVERRALGEGGSSEPAPRQWPARGHVSWGGITVLTNGVIEYEANEGTLAVTLLRCVGTISRAHLAARKVSAGPDVATPAAQMLGAHRFSLGIMPDAGRQVIGGWERFALPLLPVSAPGGGTRDRSGTLLDLDVPALSTVEGLAAGIVARVWNPYPEPVTARIEGRALEVGPHRIEDLLIR